MGPRCCLDACPGTRHLIIDRRILGSAGLDDIVLSGNRGQLFAIFVTDEDPALAQGRFLFIAQINDLLDALQVGR